MDAQAAAIATAHVPVCTHHPEVVENLYPCGRCGRTYCRDCLVGFRGQWMCAGCKRHVTRDLVAGVPAGFELASITSRFGAVFLDGALFALPYFGALMLIAFEVTDEALGMLILFTSLAALLVGRPVYEALMIRFADGQTLGKRALDVRVVGSDGAPVTTGQSWGRALARLALDSCLSLINYLPALFTKERKTLHDEIAKTRVVDAETRIRAPDEDPSPDTRCPRCRAELARVDGGVWTCPSCRHPIETIIFRPPVRPTRTLRLVETGPGGATACASHEANAASATCDRCGLVICELCRTKLPDRVLCPQCFERLHDARELPVTRTKLGAYGAMAVSMLVLGWLSLPFFGPLLAPVSIVYAVMQRNQARSLDEDPGRGMWVVIVLAVVLLLSSIGFWSLAYIGSRT